VALSEGQREQFSAWHTNILVRRNALACLPPKGPAPRSDRFTITYTGSLYPGLQSVSLLVQVLQGLLADGRLKTEDICLRYRGKDAETFEQWTAGLPAACRDIEASIAPAAAQKMQQASQVLLLLTWSAPGYYGVLTAKLWDYLGTGRPILALVNGPGDPELKGILEGAAAGAMFTPQEQEALEKWLLAAYQQWSITGELSRPVQYESLRQYLPATAWTS